MQIKQQPNLAFMAREVTSVSVHEDCFPRFLTD
jgi:hypothetical protein